MSRVHFFVINELIFECGAAFIIDIRQWFFSEGGPEAPSVALDCSGSALCRRHLLPHQSTTRPADHLAMLHPALTFNLIIFGKLMILGQMSVGLLISLH
uniref:Secreted protein n=1 Tax=Angiostrongylus cantonensis TaxID=6313 RepID=A0A0K0DNE2_ANGCA